jgi:hypothetical protein
MTHPRKKTPVYFMLDTISSALVNSHGEASLLPLLNALVRRVVPKAPGRLRRAYGGVNRAVTLGTSLGTSAGCRG